MDLQRPTMKRITLTEQPSLWIVISSSDEGFSPTNGWDRNWICHFKPDATRNSSKGQEKPAGLIVPGEALTGLPIQETSAIADLVYQLEQLGLITTKLRIKCVQATGSNGKLWVSLKAEIHLSFDNNARHLCRPSEETSPSFAIIGRRKRELPRLLTLLHHNFDQNCDHSTSVRLVDLFEKAAVIGQERLQQRLLPAKRSPFDESQSPEQPGGSQLLSLSDDVLGVLFRSLDAVDLRSLAHTCHYLEEATQAIVPGLKARLYPHQQRCLAWLLEREAGRSTIPHPAWAKVSCQEGQELWVDMVNGQVAFCREDVPHLQDGRWALLCDEPGLGKTVTALALILKTQGLRVNACPYEHSVNSPTKQLSPTPYSSPKSPPRLQRFNFRSPHSRRRELDPSSLISSAATLLVVPGPLLQHWSEQIDRHVEPCALRTYFCGGDALPEAEYLAGLDVVLVTKEKLRTEWARGRPLCALDERHPERWGDYEQDTYQGLSELLKIRWLRVMVDEGHSLGGLSITNEGRMSTRLQAERRIVITGTPSRHDAADLLSLRCILTFLRDPVYGNEDASLWNQLIARCPSLVLAQDRLMQLLLRTMIRHTKDLIPEIPKPRWRRHALQMSKLEAATYNALVSLVQANLVTTAMTGGDHEPGPRHPDSMLNPRQRKYALTVMSNLRLATCGGGGQMVEMSNGTVVETLNLAKSFGARPAEVAKIATYLSGVRAGRPSACESCGIQLHILLITPCTHLLCANCMQGQNNTCAGCGMVFSVDQFQMMQPGLSIQWRDDLTSYVPEMVNHEQRIESTEEAVNQQVRVELDSEAIAETAGQGRTWKQEGENTISGHDDGSWDVVSKGKKMMEILDEYLEQQRRMEEGLLSSCSEKDAEDRRPLKAIVFSQFRAYLNGLDAALLSRGFKVGRFYDRHRMKDLYSFQHEPTFQVLLIGKEGSHGLDLSMATHLFLMDELWDPRLQDQVVSRAYRMGAKRPVNVERLIMANTVEEKMESLAMQSQESTRRLQEKQDTEYAPWTGPPSEHCGVMRKGLLPDSERAESLEKSSKRRRMNGGIDAAQETAKLHTLLQSLELMRTGLVKAKSLDKVCSQGSDLRKPGVIDNGCKVSRMRSEASIAPDAGEISQKSVKSVRFA